MKYLKRLDIKTFTLTLTLGLIMSCSDFLDEELKTQRNTDYFSTEEGVRDLAVGLYNNLRFHFASEWAFTYTNYGTDEFQVGGDGSNAMWDNYDGNLGSLIPAVNSNTVPINALWDNMYMGINSANLILANASVVQDETARNTYMGEAHFLRGFNYLKLIRQYGGVPLKLEPSFIPQRDFKRASAEEVMEQVIADLTAAYDLLPASTSLPGKMTKDAAAHFLAKAYLFRASEINDDWNSATKDNDLVTGRAFADEVISHRILASDFEDLWAFTAIDGANEQLDEIILAAQFTSDAAAQGRFGNQQHLFFLSVYRDLLGMTRDIAGGREYQRLRTTYYSYNVYDRVNDSRFWKSFRTKWGVDVANPPVPYAHGDLAVMYIINNPTDTRFATADDLKTIVDPNTSNVIPTVYATYVNGEEYIEASEFMSRFAPLSKYMDGSRFTVNQTNGHRDGILARLADTYLTAAEFAIRQGEYGDALNYINIVRARATYQGGEDRSEYVDGGAAFNPTSNPDGWALLNGRSAFYAQNSYYESNDIAETTAATDLEVLDFGTLPPEDEAIISTLGYTDVYDRAMCFLLNERSRELMGEFHRWEDLSRTMTLMDRVTAFNGPASNNIEQKHYYRPIPQVHLDAIQTNGRALTPDEKDAEQNPGY